MTLYYTEAQVCEAIRNAWASNHSFNGPLDEYGVDINVICASIVTELLNQPALRFNVDLSVKFDGIFDGLAPTTTRTKR